MDYFTSRILKQAESKGSKSPSENCCTFNQTSIFSCALWEHVFPPLLTWGLEASWARSSLSSSSLVESTLKPEVLFAFPPTPPSLGNTQTWPEDLEHQQLFPTSCTWLGQQRSPLPIPCPASLHQPEPGKSQPSGLHSLPRERAGRGGRAAPMPSCCPCKFYWLGPAQRNRSYKLLV